MAKLSEQLSNPRSKIDKSLGEIEMKIKGILSKPHMHDIFEVTITDVIEYNICEQTKLEIANKYFGKKLIISDHVDWSTAEIVKTYREQDNIEKLFRETKNTDHFSIRPQYHYTDQKIRVIFCCLLGLVLATVLHKEITEKGVAISKIKMLDTLRKIRQCWVKKSSTLKIERQFEELTESQENMWKIIEKIK